MSWTEGPCVSGNVCLISPTTHAQCVDVGGMNIHLHFRGFCTFIRNPLKTLDILVQTQSEDILSSTKIDEWVTAYKLREKMRCAPDARNSLTDVKVVLFSSREFFQN